MNSKHTITIRRKQTTKNIHFQGGKTVDKIKEKIIYPSPLQKKNPPPYPHTFWERRPNSSGQVPATARGDKKNIGTFIGSHKSSDENEGSQIDSRRQRQGGGTRGGEESRAERGGREERGV